MFTKEKLYIILSVLLTLPWIISLVFSIHYEPYVVAFLSGLAVVSASFLLSWAAETAELDIPGSLSLAIVALIAVLPEYAVDVYLAYTAGKNPEYVHYATANMTGANRLLIGIGWSIIILYTTLKTGRKTVHIDEDLRLEISFLALATFYSFIIPIKGSISLADSAVLIVLYLSYIYLSIKSPHREIELTGVPKYLSKFRHRTALIAIFFIFSAFVILVSVESFVNGLIETASMFKISPFVMVQWVAPIASESPELIVAFYLVRKLRTSAGLNTLISSKINQWTLLIGSLAIVYSISLMSPASIPLDTRQREEIFLTAAQSLFGLAIILDLKVSRLEGLLLLILFLIQLIIPSFEVRLIVSMMYIILALPIIVKKRKCFSKSFNYVVELLS